MTSNHCSTNDSADHNADINPVVGVASEARSADAPSLSKADSDDAPKRVAQAFGQSGESARTHGHGRPVVRANLKKGETVLDIRSRDGDAIFLASETVGPTGRAIGLDASDDMITVSRKKAAERGLKPPQVAFVNAPLAEPLPVESNSVDCVISHSALNDLSDDGKVSVLKEAHRVLKPEGRITIDVTISKDSTTSGLSALERFFQDAGFSSVVSVKAIGSESNVNDLETSYQVYAVKNVASDSVEIPSTVLARWWDAYPVVKSSPPGATAEEVAERIRQANKEGDGKNMDFAVIDVRRNDHAGGHVRGSHNWHAQTFYDDMPKFFEEFKNTPRVYFYCQSSNGRGPRSAGWYQDYLDSHPGEHKSQAYVLKGGIKNWKATFAGQEDLIDFDKE